MRIRSLALTFATLALALTIQAEPAFYSASASQTVASHALPGKTMDVTIVSDGASTCYFRLFTDADTAANATTSDAPIKSGESLSFSLRTGVGSEAYVGSKRATQYSSVSYICASGQTATWRIYSK